MAKEAILGYCAGGLKAEKKNCRTNISIPEELNVLNSEVNQLKRLNLSAYANF